MSSAPQIHTYHCTACTAHLLSLSFALPSSPHRTLTTDRALIIPPSVSFSSLSISDAPPSKERLLAEWHATTTDPEPVIIRLSAGYERRWLRRCETCRCVVGYALGGGDEGTEEKAYVLEDALVSTEQLKADGKRQMG